MGGGKDANKSFGKAFLNMLGVHGRWLGKMWRKPLAMTTPLASSMKYLGGGEGGGDLSTTKITIEPMHWNLIAQKLGFVNHV